TDERRREVRYKYALTGISYPSSSGETGVQFQRLTELEYPDATADSSGDETHLVTQYNGPADGGIGRASALALGDGDRTPQVDGQYSRLGIGTFAVTDLSGIGVELDRTVDSAGNRDYGTYASSSTHGKYGGWDKYGRLARNSWVGIGYGSTAGPPPVSNMRQPLWQEVYGYDALSRQLGTADGRDDNR